MKNLQILGYSVSKPVRNCRNSCLSVDVDTGDVYLVSSSHLIGFAPSTQTVSIMSC